MVLPESPEQIDPDFFIENRKNEFTPFKVSFNDSAEIYRMSGFNPKLETKILIHGGASSKTMAWWMRKMKEAFLSQQDYNIITLDWSKRNLGAYVQVNILR